MSTLSKENPIVFQNKNVTVLKDGRWACKKCRRDALERRITSPNLNRRHEMCKFENEYSMPCNQILDDDPGFRTFANLGSSPRSPPPPRSPHPNSVPDYPAAASAMCGLFGTCMSALATGGGTRKYIKSKRRKTKRKKMKKRKTNRRKMKRRKNKNTKVQKRAR